MWTFILCLVVVLPAFGADTLFSAQNEGLNIELKFARGQKQLSLSVRHIGSGRAPVERIFSIANPGEIDALTAQAVSLLQSHNANRSDIESIATIFEEFKFVSTANCQAIHLGEELTSDTRAIEDLVREFDRISAGIRGEGNFERSIELFEVTVPNVGSFQLRALVDSQGNPVKLSLSQDGETLKDFKVVRNGDTFTFSTNAGVPLITIQNHGMKNRMVSLAAYGKDGLETIVRTHIKLEAQNGNLNATVVATSQDTDNERVGAVRLTTVSVEHRPVVRHAQMDIFIPSLENSALRQRVATSPFGRNAVETSTFSAEANANYDACLSEAFVLRHELERSDTDNQLIQRCLGRIALEFADQSFASNPQKQTDFRNCLVSAGAIRTQGEGREFVDGFFKNDEESQTALEGCLAQMKEHDVRRSVEAYLASEHFAGDESFAPLLQSVTQLAMQTFSSCDGDDCQSRAIARASQEMFKLKFLRWFDEASIGALGTQRDELVNDYTACAGAKDLDQCQRELMVAAIRLLPSQMYDRISTESGLSAKAQADDSQAVIACMNQNFSRIATGDFSSFDEWRYRCSFNQFKTKLPNLASEHWANELARYGVVHPIEGVVNSVQIALSGVATSGDAKKAIEDAGISAYSVGISRILDTRLDERLPAGTNETEEARAIVLERLSAMTSPGSYDLVESTGVYLRRTAQARGAQGIQTGFRDLVMRVHTVPRQFELVRSLDPAYRDDNQLTQQVAQLTSSYEDCWGEFDANGSSDVLAHALKCDKATLADEKFSLISQELRQFVSRRFPLASNEANEILTPLHYMDKCFQDGDPLGNSTYAEYEQWLNACIVVTRVDIASNLYEKLEHKYKPVLSGADQAGLKAKIACFREPLKSMVGDDGESFFKDDFENPEGHEQARSIEDIMAVSDQLNGAGSLLSSMFTQENFDQVYREGDRAVLQGYLKLLAGKGSDDQLMSKIEACSEQFDEILTSGFRTYLMASVPNLYGQIVPFLGAPQQRLIEEVIDVEMAELLLQVQAKSEYRTVESDAPGGTIVTSDFTISAMARFIEGMGQYIAQGFVFDMNEMKTELVVFKEELKDALRWVVESDQPVSLEELGRFFSESKLADHMALAHVAKNTNDNFQSFLSGMYEKEVADFWERVKKSNSGFFNWIIGRDENHLSSKQKRELKEIEEKYESLKTLARNMTAGYDFRRIFNVYGEEGREALNMIKEQDFLPRLAGRTPSAVNRAQIDSAIAERILADNAPGGFTERFVREMAQEYLTKQSRSKWGITKWLFYDDGDFDWEVVRETESGRKAIEYYGKFVLLPKMLGQSLTRYEENLHKGKFEELLRKAQKENR